MKRKIEVDCETKLSDRWRVRKTWKEVESTRQLEERWTARENW